MNKNNIIVTITNGETNDTYTIEANKEGGTIVKWSDQYIPKANYYTFVDMPHIIDAARQLAHYMDIHTACEH